MRFFGLAIALDGAILVYYGLNRAWSSSTVPFWAQVTVLVGIPLIGLGLSMAFETRRKPIPPPKH